MDASIARSLWSVLDPVQQAPYLSGELRELLAGAGITGLDHNGVQLVGRAAPLGPVAAKVIAAAMYHLSPAVVAAHLPAAFATCPAEKVCQLREQAADRVLRVALGEVIGSVALRRAAALARGAAEAAPVHGRLLAAAHASLPWPTDAHLALWHAATLLCEHRADAHVIALEVAGLDPVEAYVLQEARVREPGATAAGWTSTEIEHAKDRLISRRLLTGEGRLTAHARAVGALVRHRTDELSVAPYRAIGDAATQALLDGLGAIAAAMPQKEAGSYGERAHTHEEHHTMTVSARSGHGADHRIRATIVTKGHRFEQGPFFAMFDDNPQLEWRHVEHPDVDDAVSLAGARETDVYVFYDMPGIEFRPDEPPRYGLPSKRYVAGMRRLFATGKPMVFLHHSLASWPAWPEFGEIVGGRFLYSPGLYNGRRFPDSGYRDGVRQRLTPVDPSHPICEGLEDGFELEDEVYLCPILEHAITPLFTSDFSFADTDVYSAAQAVAGKRDSNEGWRHPKGSNVVAWIKRYDLSPIVYLQPGDGPAAYENQSYRRLLANAIAWAASPDAEAWAKHGS